MSISGEQGLTRALLLNCINACIVCIVYIVSHAKQCIVTGGGGGAIHLVECIMGIKSRILNMVLNFRHQEDDNKNYTGWRFGKTGARFPFPAFLSFFCNLIL